MTAETKLYFNTKDEEGNEKQFIFDTYLDGDLPEDCGCVYIFATTDPNNNGVKNNHIGSIERLSMIFDKENIEEKLKKYNSNSILIYKCDDPDEMDNIVQWIRKSHNLDY